LSPGTSQRQFGQHRGSQAARTLPGNIEKLPKAACRMGMRQLRVTSALWIADPTRTCTTVCSSSAARALAAASCPVSRTRLDKDI
jgi:hypothetical protein